MPDFSDFTDLLKDSPLWLLLLGFIQITVPLIIGALAGVGAYGIGASIGAAIAIGVVTAAGLYFLQASLRVPNFRSESGLRTKLRREPTEPRRVVYGQIRLSGPLLYFETQGDNNDNLHMYVALCGHEVEEIGNIYIDDDPVTLDGNGLVDSGKFSGNARFDKLLGTAGQTATTWASTESDGLDSNARGRGVAMIHADLLFDREKFSTGVPNISAVVKGRQVYDPRVAAYDPREVGAVRVYTYTSGSVFFPATNPALCLLDYLLDTDYGLKATNAEIDWASFITAATVCDQDVTLNAGGDEKRYTCNGTFTTAQKPADIIGQLLSAMQGRFFYVAGVFGVKAGAYEAPTITLTEDDLRSGLEVQTKQSRRDSFNAVKGLYANPDEDWQASDFPEITNSTYETEDGGDRSYQDIDLPFTTSVTTAQRLAKIILESNRRQITCKVPCKLSALQVQGGDTVQVTNTRLGWTAKVFLVDSLSFVETGSGNVPVLAVDLILREWDSSIFTWADTEEGQTNAPEGTFREQPEDLTCVYSGGPDKVTLTWTDPTPPAGITLSELEVIRGENTNPNHADWIADVAVTLGTYVDTGTTESDAYYYWVRGKYSDGSFSTFTGPITAYKVLIDGETDVYFRGKFTHQTTYYHDTEIILTPETRRDVVEYGVFTRFIVNNEFLNTLKGEAWGHPLSSVNWKGTTLGQPINDQGQIDGSAADTSTLSSVAAANDLVVSDNNSLVVLSGSAGNIMRRNPSSDEIEFVSPGNDSKVAASSGTNYAIDLDSGNLFEITLDNNVTFTVTNPFAAGKFRLILIQDGGGTNTVTWPASFKWAGGVAPVLTTGGGDIHVLDFTTSDTGTSWHGLALVLDSQ